jgi:hypothetical protein
VNLTGEITNNVSGMHMADSQNALNFDPLQRGGQAAAQQIELMSWSKAE